MVLSTTHTPTSTVVHGCSSYDSFKYLNIVLPYIEIIVDTIATPL